jgi:CRISPR-associated protein Cmr6
MALLAARDTSDALKSDALQCENRSLILERFGQLAAKEPTQWKRRFDYLEQALAKPPLPHKQMAWRDFLWHGLAVEPQGLLFGHLQGRLVLNRVGGLGANASPCLDRLTGIPFIPGSAIKGCARRMAIELLHDCVDKAAKAKLLTDIAQVFGWIASDWNTRPSRWSDRVWEQNRSDLAWACGDADWPTLSEEARRTLSQGQVQGRPGNIDGRGAVQFLPSYPLPADLWPYPQPDLELDVRACHHPQYYRGPSRPRETASDRPRDGQNRQAPDVEEPSTEVFPVVAPGPLYVFVILPTRACRPEVLATARGWLQAGLETFGLGAKTAAGYGWFDCSEALQSRIRELWGQTGEAEKKRLLQEREAEEQRAREATAQQAALSLKEALATMSPEELEDYQITQLSDDQFRSKLQYFSRDLGTKEQLAVVRALREGRAKFWDDLKQRAKKGGHWAQVEQAIRGVAKKAGLGKMP